MPIKLRLIIGLLHIVSHLPLRAQRWLGCRLGEAMWRWDKRSRRVCRANIDLCFPELDPAQKDTLCRESLRHTGMAFTELAASYYWPAAKLKACVRFDDQAILNAAIAEGKGVILASPHFGNWEMTGQYLGQSHAMHVLFRPAKDPFTDTYIMERRSRLGASLLPTDTSGVRGLSKALKRGEIIGILPDQEPDLQGGVFAPFFGQQALTMTLLSKLARRRQVPVLLTYMRRTNAGFQFHLDRLPEDIYTDDMTTSASALNYAIEALVRRYPEQYIWNYKRFSERPPGATKVY